jgi:hypothetical protein
VIVPRAACVGGFHLPYETSVSGLRLMEVNAPSKGRFHRPDDPVPVTAALLQHDLCAGQIKLRETLIEPVEADPETT